MTRPADDTLRLQVSRVFTASVEKVFDCWLDRASVGKWLFATPTGEMQRVELDPRVGGQFLVIEKRGDILAEHFGKYLEIDRPRRLVFEFATSGERRPTTVTVEFRTVDSGCCEVTLSHAVLPEWADFLERAKSGWTKMLEGLATTLAKAAVEKPLVLSRVFNAPRAVVFKAWTDPKQVAQWWGPNGFTAPVCEVDARPGGKIRIDMHGPDGSINPMTGVFEELVEPERIVMFATAAVDSQGQPLVQVRNTITLPTREAGPDSRFTPKSSAWRPRWRSPSAAWRPAGHRRSIAWKRSRQDVRSREFEVCLTVTGAP